MTEFDRDNPPDEINPERWREWWDRDSDACREYVDGKITLRELIDPPPDRDDPPSFADPDVWIDYCDGKINLGELLLSATPERELRRALIRWLKRNDPSGVYSDDDCRDEGLEPLSLRDLLEFALEQLEE